MDPNQPVADVVDAGDVDAVDRSPERGGVVTRMKEDYVATKGLAAEVVGFVIHLLPPVN